MRHRGLKPGLCDNLEGWDGVGGGRGFKREGTHVYLCLIHVDVWQKPTQHYKAIILQLKINKLKQTNKQTLSMPHNPPVLRPRFRKLGWGLRIGVSNKFPSDPGVLRPTDMYFKVC